MDAAARLPALRLQEPAMGLRQWSQQRESLLSQPTLPRPKTMQAALLVLRPASRHKVRLRSRFRSIQPRPEACPCSI